MGFGDPLGGVLNYVGNAAAVLDGIGGSIGMGAGVAQDIVGGFLGPAGNLGFANQLVNTLSQPMMSNLGWHVETMPQFQLPSPIPPFPGPLMAQGMPTSPGETLNQLGGSLNEAFKGMNTAMQNVDQDNPTSFLDAQKAMNQYEQLMQLMTTMMKQLHDLNMAIIRNLH